MFSTALQMEIEDLAKEARRWEQYKTILVASGKAGARPLAFSYRRTRRWLHVDEMPFSRAITYKLIDAGLISSVVVTWPGSRRGRRLIDGDSLDSYLETLAAKPHAKAN
jgi:hypothetical protein